MASGEFVRFYKNGSPNSQQLQQQLERRLESVRTYFVIYVKQMDVYTSTVTSICMHEETGEQVVAEVAGQHTLTIYPGFEC